MSALQHIPLDRSARQIRLLRFLKPDGNADAIRCRLDTYDLEGCPSFVALSYTWGNAHPSRTMTLNGEVFPVRQNLHSALSVLMEDALKHGSRWDVLYWIDAICINQQDDSERGHQVNMMGTIYSEARFVLVWLGAGCAISNRAMRTLVAYSDQRTQWSGPPLWGNFSLIEESGIAASEYWQRVWVIQEFTLAKDMFVLRGHYRLSWYNLKHILYSIDDEDEFSAMYRLVDFRIRWEQRSLLATTETTLDSLLTISEWSRCSDIRDKVYALLSLVQKQSDDSKRLYPDYTVSPRQLYYKALGNLRHSRTLRDTGNWVAFREQLRLVLDIPRDEDFEINDFLYRSSEYERPHQKPLLSLYPDHRIKLSQAFLKDVADYLHWPLADMDGDPQSIYKKVIQNFQRFPKEEDPEAWNCFDSLLQEALDLFSITSKDSEMWDMFIDFQE